MYRQIDTLSVDRTKVTEAGLAHLLGFAGFEELKVKLPRLTDARLEPFAG
jgi:hypothetical protein